jgi:hypothetical protein
MEWGFIKECTESDKFLFRHSTRVRRKLFGKCQNSLDNESRNRIRNRRIVEDCASNTGKNSYATKLKVLALNGKWDASETA